MLYIRFFLVINLYIFLKISLNCFDTVTKKRTSMCFLCYVMFVVKLIKFELIFCRFLENALT